MGVRQVLVSRARTVTAGLQRRGDGRINLVTTYLRNRMAESDPEVKTWCYRRVRNTCFLSAPFANLHGPAAIDYINALLYEHSELRERLQRAKDVALSRGLSHVLHSGPAMANGVPLWERVWNGGTGIDDAEEDGGDSDYEDHAS